MNISFTESKKKIIYKILLQLVILFLFFFLCECRMKVADQIWVLGIIVCVTGMVHSQEWEDWEGWLRGQHSSDRTVFCILEIRAIL